MSADDLFTDLRQNLVEGNVCAFVGAELGVVAGLPTWYDLVSQLAQRIAYDLPPRQWCNSVTLHEAVQAYIHSRGLFSLITLLKEWLDTFSLTPTPTHLALARLPISLLFTSSLDDLLEKAYRTVGKRVEVVLKDESIPFMRRGENIVTIVKLAGDLTQPDTLRLGHEPSQTYWNQHPQILKLLEVEMARSNALYVGWSHLDAYFDLVFRSLPSQFGQWLRPGYAALVSAPPTVRQSLQKQHMQILDFADDSSIEQLTNWLEGLQLPPMITSLSAVDEESTISPQLLNPGQSWALLVGVNAYEDEYISDLHVSVADTTAVAQRIEGQYQAVRLLTDATAKRLPTRANILSELSTLSAAADENDLLLFYFSGHGIALDGESYLAPADAKLAALRHTAIAIRDVRQILEQSPARAKVIIIDACHAGASIGKATTIMAPEFIQRVFAQAEGMVVFCSCKQGQQSWEWPGKRQSVFTHYLLEALDGHADYDQKGFVTVTDANRYVVDQVKQWSVKHNAPQTPTLQSISVGDIILTYQPKS
jgi:hypothetical protein